MSVRRDVLTERAGLLHLAQPGRVSANGSCRLVESQQGWLAVNLPRESDVSLVPAWTGCAPDVDPWRAVSEAAALEPAMEFAARGQELGLAVAVVGSFDAHDFLPPVQRMTDRPGILSARALRVVDMSDLWAGPLCGALFAETGAEVVKIRTGRSSRSPSPDFEKRLNGRKREIAVDIRNPQERDALKAEIAGSHVLITSARARAFDQLDLSPQALFALNPSLIWIAITAYGWHAANAMSIGFGDDAAAAGGLVTWRHGQPQFVGDAIADPLTGLAAASAGFAALTQGGGVLIDAALARTAAGIAALSPIAAEFDA